MIDRRSAVDAAQGRWREILPALGISADLLNGKHHPCPMCGGTDRFRFSNRNEEGVYYCNQCGAGSGFQLLERFHGWDFKRAANEVNRIIGNLPPKSEGPDFKQVTANPAIALRRLYSESEPITSSTPAGRYLISRGISSPGEKRALRYVPMMRHGRSGTVQHGMIATFSDAGGKPATIHRTFITKDGCKADVDPVRMFMPGNVPSGGAIRLYDPHEVMGIAEGIETALSAALMHGIPTWATTSAVLLERWEPPAIAKRITIFGDNDANFTGQAAAFTLAKRLVFEANKAKIEREVTVTIPPNRGDDWNDVMMKEQKHDIAV